MASLVCGCSASASSDLFDVNGGDASAGGDAASGESADADASTGSNAALDGGAQMDSGGGTRSVVCPLGGGLSCSLPSQECCRFDADGGAGFAFGCAAVSQGCTGGLAIPCDDSSDCPSGNVCCVNANILQQALSVACRPPPQCAGLNDIVLCNKTGTCANPVKTCRESSITIPPYYGCFDP